MVLAMAAMSYAAVPLYKIFCQATGQGGTTQKALAPSTSVVDRIITVRFDANVTPGMPWNFEPDVRSVQVKVGENVLAFFKATNTSDKAIKGTASYNVSPDPARRHTALGDAIATRDLFLMLIDTLTDSDWLPARRSTG